MTILWKNLHLIWDCGVTDLVYSGLWEYIKGRVLGVQRVNELGELTNDVPEMCNPLLNQYNSVFSTPCREKDITNPEEFFNVELEDSNDNDILSDIIINQSVICDAINEMSSSSASGPDGLPAILFKECRDELSIPLQILFAKSFSENHIRYSTVSQVCSYCTSL